MRVVNVMKFTSNVINFVSEKGIEVVNNCLQTV